MADRSLLAASVLGLVVGCRGGWEDAVTIERSLSSEDQVAYVVETAIEAAAPIDCVELGLSVSASWSNGVLRASTGERDIELSGSPNPLDTDGWDQDGPDGCFATAVVLIFQDRPIDGTLRATVNASEDRTSPSVARDDLVLTADWASTD